MGIIRSVSSGFSAPAQPQIETSGSIFHLIYIPFHSLFSVLQINSPLHPLFYSRCFCDTLPRPQFAQLGLLGGGSHAED